MQIFNIPQNICERILLIFIILTLYSCLGNFLENWRNLIKTETPYRDLL